MLPPDTSENDRKLGWLGAADAERMENKMELRVIKEDAKDLCITLTGLVFGDCNILVSYLTAWSVLRGGRWVVRHQQC